MELVNKKHLFIRPPFGSKPKGLISESNYKKGPYFQIFLSNVFSLAFNSILFLLFYILFVFDKAKDNFKFRGRSNCLFFF